MVVAKAPFRLASLLVSVESLRKLTEVLKLTVFTFVCFLILPYVQKNKFFPFLGLIKHGCSSGSITITLSNTGINAHKPVEYGDEIQIVRSLGTGSSSYKILSKYGIIFGFRFNTFMQYTLFSSL